ncbi:MAG TPA: LysR substrate-binding domain-containing protein [Dongiaceae bacterium]|nr:LysR substrate-binding domain-containing protein [Dongiaceae bacterium]
MSLRKSLPSTVALFMFEAAAKHLNFTRAAAEFNVTQSAVSRMIKRLETHLVTVLFRRGPTGLELTEDGEMLYKAVGQGFQTIEAALDELRVRQGKTGMVTISISSAFAVHWFVPMVDRFQASFPNIDLRFQLVKGEPVGPFDDVDLAIRHNHPPNADQHSWKLMDEIVVPVCSPDYAKRHGTLLKAKEDCPHMFANLAGTMRVPWQRFLEQTGAPAPKDARNITFSDYTLVVQSALKGRAMALGWLHVVGLELLGDGLVRAGRQELRTGLSYDIVASTKRPLRQSAILVKEWLISEMRSMEDQLRPATGLKGA